MTVITGATIVAAQAPETKSDANRRPKFFVFHTRASVNGASVAVFGIVTATLDGSISTLLDGCSRPGRLDFIVGALMVYNYVLLDIRD